MTSCIGKLAKLLGENAPPPPLKEKREETVYYSTCDVYATLEDGSEVPLAFNHNSSGNITRDFFEGKFGKSHHDKTDSKAYFVSIPKEDDNWSIEKWVNTDKIVFIHFRNVQEKKYTREVNEKK